MARLRDYHYFVAVMPFLCSTIWKQNIEKSGIQMNPVFRGSVFRWLLYNTNIKNKIVSYKRVSSRWRALKKKKRNVGAMHQEEETSRKKWKTLLFYFLFMVYLFSVHKLNFQIIFDLKYDLYSSQATLLFIFCPINDMTWQCK